MDFLVEYIETRPNPGSWRTVVVGETSADQAACYVLDNCPVDPDYGIVVRELSDVRRTFMRSPRRIYKAAVEELFV